MKGLTTKIPLIKGKFQLINGVEKSRDNIWFFCVFDKKRIYTSDFGANLLSLIQKPISYVVMNKTLILGTLRKSIEKYVPNVKVETIDFGYRGNDRRHLSAKIEYTSVQENKTEIKDVTFV